jgi:hypothetical protein
VSTPADFDGVLARINATLSTQLANASAPASEPNQKLSDIERESRATLEKLSATVYQEAAPKDNADTSISLSRASRAEEMIRNVSTLHAIRTRILPLLILSMNAFWRNERKMRKRNEGPSWFNSYTGKVSSASHELQENDVGGSERFRPYVPVYTSRVACSVVWPFPILLPMISLCHLTIAGVLCITLHLLRATKGSPSHCVKGYLLSLMVLLIVLPPLVRVAK